MTFISERYLDLVSGRSRGVVAEGIRGLLRLLTLPYLGVIVARNAYFDVFPRAARSAGCPVVSVGNITVGGTGKTPVAVRVANLLSERGRRVALLLRGYKGRAIQFDADQRDRAAGQWRQESDEAMVLKRRCPSATVMVNPNRLASARQAVSRGADMLVLDDGFQHRKLGRDLDIVLVDATVPYGHGHLLPRGLLREPTRSLRRADLIVMTRSDQIDETNRTLLRRRLRQLSGDKPVIQAVHRIVGFTDIKGSDMASFEGPSVMQAVIFAGIANFASFRRSVEELGVKVLAAYEYPDHHDYSNDEMAALADVASNLEANVILTTEKDAVKLVGRWNDEACRLMVVKLEIGFDAEGDRIFAEAIDAVLKPVQNAPVARASGP